MRRTLIAILSCVLSAIAPTAGAGVASSDEQLTRQAIQLYAQQQAQQAIAMEMQAAKTNPGKWLPHAVLSYFLWHESKPKEAIIEGDLAIRHAPRNSVLLINLGIMEQASGDLKSAVSCFAKARALAPSDWKAWIGEAQSLILAGRADEAATILGEMASLSSNDFNWYYELGQTYLHINRPDLCASVAPKSIKLATTAEQKSNSLFQLFLAYLRDNQIERAGKLKHQVFYDNKPIDAQIYLGAASALVPVLQPDAAVEILNSAVANLEEISDSETFFRLAKIFEEKANFVSYDSTKYGAWLQNQEVAYRQAIKLNPRPPIYHVALAGVLAQNGKADEMAQELATALKVDSEDQLAGYLLFKLNQAPSATTEQHPKLSGSTPAPATSVHMTEAQIAINGLSCACNRSIIADSFKRIKGLVLTIISSKIPYKATVLVDRSIISIADALSQMTQNKPFSEVSYQLISSQPIESAWEALKIDVDGHTLNYRLYATDWNQMEATLPVSQAP